jgi:hypothetical protein
MDHEDPHQRLLLQLAQRTGRIAEDLVRRATSAKC